MTLSSNGPSPVPAWVCDAETRLRSLGITARVIRSHSQLERIEHWNWSFLESFGVWVKPLLPGDLLESIAIEAILHTIGAFPDAALLRCNHDLWETHEVARPAAPRFISAGEMRHVVLRSEYVSVPIRALAFKRDALLALGGLRPMLPLAGDHQLHSEFAVCYGEVQIPMVLSRSSAPSMRSTDSPPASKCAVSREETTRQAMLAYHAWTTGKAVPLNTLFRMMAAAWIKL